MMKSRHFEVIERYYVPEMNIYIYIIKDVKDK